MKNKKSIAMAMAAVSTLGAVAPAFANEIQGRAVIESNAAEIDARLASGYKSVENDNVFTRAEIFNYNGDETDRDKHTLKNAYKDMVILAEQLAENPAEDLFVLGEKALETDVKLEKARIEVLKEEVDALVKNGYKVTETTEEADKAKIEGTDTKTYTPGTREFTLSKEGETNIVITVNNVDGIEVTDQTEEEKEAKKTEALRKSVFGEDATDVTNVEFNESTDYSEVNLLKYQIESNIDKFDIVTDEDDDHTGLVVTLYRKGVAQNKSYAKVMTINFKNIEDIEDKNIVTIPQTNDFNTNWAKEEIVKAMIAGKVDVAENFRPQDGITRAEFAKVVCTMFDIEPNDTDSEPFHDVSKADGWKYDYIAALYTQGADGNIKVIQGSDDKFRPDDKISREEVAVILSKMVSQEDKEKITEVNGEKIHNIIETRFEDTKDIAPWADHSVNYLSSDNEAKYDGTNYIVKGDQNKFNPKQEITRAEALVMIERASIAESKISRP